MPTPFFEVVSLVLTRTVGHVIYNYGTALMLRIGVLYYIYINSLSIDFTFPSSRLHPSSAGASMCTSEQVHFWASSYGSRFSILRDRNVACFAVLNQPSQLGMRSHFIGHNISAVARSVFPVLGSA
jgi:hypothetical protein